MILREYVNSVLNEATGQKYYEIVFMQGDDAKEALDILEKKGEKAALQYLKDWDYGKEMEHTAIEKPWGNDDELYEEDDYVMSYNTRLGYIGLVRRQIKGEEEQPRSPKEETPPPPEEKPAPAPAEKPAPTEETPPPEEAGK